MEIIRASSAAAGGREDGPKADFPLSNLTFLLGLGGFVEFRGCFKDLSLLDFVGEERVTLRANSSAYAVEVDFRIVRGMLAA